MRILALASYLAAGLVLAACLMAPRTAPTATPVGATPTKTPAKLTGAAAPPATPRSPQPIAGGSKQYAAPPVMSIDPKARYTATIRTNRGSMTIDLLASAAPKTVNNFVFLAGEGFYNGVIFHRVIPKFMIQGGDPTGTGTGGPGYRFEDETSPTLVFDRPGYLAMANAGANTNGSQFFITVAPTPHLSGAHTIFGRVVGGQEVADAISRVATGAGNRPIEPVTIQGIEIKKSGG